MKNWEILTLENTDLWNKYISNLPINLRDVYIKPEYFKLYEKYLDCKVECFIYKQNNNLCIFPYLIKEIKIKNQVFNKKYYDAESVYGYSGIVFNTKDIKFIHESFFYIKEYFKKKNIVICFLKFNPLQFINNEIHKFVEISRDRKIIYIKVDNEYDDIFNKQYSSNNRNMIRKARKKYNISIGNSKDHIDLFIKNYNENLSRLKADEFYYFNKKYFDSLLNPLENLGFVLNVFDDKNVCQASSVILTSGYYAHYHLSGKSINNNDNSITNFMLDEIIKYLNKNNYKFFNLGGGRTNKFDDTLFKFKKNFSDSLLDFYFGKLIIDKKKYNELCAKWEKENPNKAIKYKNYVLKYRY